MFIREIIRRKWEKLVDLPLVNIVLKKIKEQDLFFNLENYLQTYHEKYFELMEES